MKITSHVYFHVFVLLCHLHISKIRWRESCGHIGGSDNKIDDTRLVVSDNDDVNVTGQ